MKNKLEIEKKYFTKNTTTEKLTEIILKTGAKYCGENKQHDIYFNVPGRDSFSSKECLRIRESESKKEITYKAPTKERDMNANFFAKEEVNLLIQDIGEAKKLLLSLGCEILAEVKKKRMRFKLDKFKIFIDNVWNIGLFLEIEIIDNSDNIGKNLKKIDDLMEKMEIGDCIVENKPYRDIVIKKQKGEI